METKQTVSPEDRYVVCLGRQFGSGGSAVGRRLAELLDIAYYDREIVNAVARQSGLDEAYLSGQDEQAPGFFDYATFGHFGTPRLFGSGQNFVMLTETLREVASRRSCLIVGRTADYILRGEPRLVRLFVHAPRRYRIRNVARRMNISAEDADSLITRYDRERARFYDFFTDRTWGQADTYDLSVDVARLGEEGTAQFLRHYIQLRLGL